VWVTIEGGDGYLALKGARAGPCDDEDKMCCLRECVCCLLVLHSVTSTPQWILQRENERDSERKEIKMSPLKQVKITKSVDIGVFQSKSLDIYYIFFSKKAKSGYNWLVAIISENSLYLNC
jgi:hypothetical protein